jgi:ABC-type uncharacterized transport system involved in gliding motility auxiliary subunit
MASDSISAHQKPKPIMKTPAANAAMKASAPSSVKKSPGTITNAMMIAEMTMVAKTIATANLMVRCGFFEVSRCLDDTVGGDVCVAVS